MYACPNSILTFSIQSMAFPVPEVLLFVERLSGWQLTPDLACSCRDTGDSSAGWVVCAKGCAVACNYWNTKSGLRTRVSLLRTVMEIIYFSRYEVNQIEPLFRLEVMPTFSNEPIPIAFVPWRTIDIGSPSNEIGAEHFSTIVHDSPLGRNFRYRSIIRILETSITTLHCGLWLSF